MPPAREDRIAAETQDHRLDASLDVTHAAGAVPAGARTTRRRSSLDLPIRNINRTVGTILSQRSHAALRRRRLRARRHDPAQFPRHRRPKPDGLRRAWRDGSRRRGRERLLRQGTLRRQGHRLSAAREHVQGRREHHRRQRRAVRRHQRRGVICAASPANGSASATAARRPSSKGSAIMAANT